MSRPWFDLTTGMLLLACALFAYLLTRPPALSESPAASSAAPAPPDAASTAPEAAPPLPLRYFDEVWKRPLFNPERRPPVVADKPVVARPATLQFSLEGVVVSSDQRSVLLRGRRNELVRLAEGVSYQGWRLTAVEVQGARFSRGAQQLELRLRPTENP